MKRLSALLATVVLVLCFGASQAVAAEGDQGAGQAAGQSAGSGQSASGYGGAYQAGPTNSAGSIRVLSPGDNGELTQSNSSTAGAIAANGNKTTQGVDQSQIGRLRLRPDPDRRPGGEERAVRRREREGQADRPEERVALDPCSEPR